MQRPRIYPLWQRRAAPRPSSAACPPRVQVAMNTRQAGNKVASSKGRGVTSNRSVGALPANAANTALVLRSRGHGSGPPIGIEPGSVAGPGTLRSRDGLTPHQLEDATRSAAIAADYASLRSAASVRARPSTAQLLSRSPSLPPRLMATNHKESQSLPSYIIAPGSRLGPPCFGHHAAPPNMLLRRSLGGRPRTAAASRRHAEGMMPMSPQARGGDGDHGGGDHGADGGLTSSPVSSSHPFACGSSPNRHTRSAPTL